MSPREQRLVVHGVFGVRFALVPHDAAQRRTARAARSSRCRSSVMPPVSIPRRARRRARIPAARSGTATDRRAESSCRPPECRCALVGRAVQPARCVRVERVDDDGVLAGAQLARARWRSCDPCPRRKWCRGYTPFSQVVSTSSIGPSARVARCFACAAVEPDRRAIPDHAVEAGELGNVPVLPEAERFGCRAATFRRRSTA